jgi:hypothetical protein
MVLVLEGTLYRVPEASKNWLPSYSSDIWRRELSGTHGRGEKRQQAAKMVGGWRQ